MERGIELTLSIFGDEAIRDKVLAHFGAGSLKWYKKKLIMMSENEFYHRVYGIVPKSE